MKISILCILTTMIALGSNRATAKQEIQEPRINVLLITLDDMGYQSLGITGCKIPDITPHIDRLASEGIIFQHGHVVTTICSPSRSVMLSGRYPHNNGIMGHVMGQGGRQPFADWEPPDIITPPLPEYLSQHGYLTGAILKVAGLEPITFHTLYNDHPFGVGFHDRNPQSFYNRTKAFLDESKSAGKPFFLYANPIDPHRPWPDTDQERQKLATFNPDKPYPSPEQKYAPERIDVPDFLPDLPKVREALVPYYESVHRGDACVGAILKAVDDSRLRENTVVIFLSDHGMAFAGAKFSLYHASTRTPIVVRWPKVVKAGQIDTTHVVSSVDLMPTIVEAVGLPPIQGMDGISFLPLAKGQPSSLQRQRAYSAHSYGLSFEPRSFYPMRTVTDTDYLYIWNGYTERESTNKPFNRYYHEVLAPYTNDEYPKVKQRVDLLVNKPAEEFYDLSDDPGCWNNLADNSEYRKKLSAYRNFLREEMKRNSDPELKYFRP